MTAAASRTDAPWRAATALRERFGLDPASLWSAPGRVNLIGEHTDYNDGYVLPFAVPQRTAVAAAPAPGPGWAVWSESTGELVRFGPDALVPGRVTGWAGYLAGVVWALGSAGHHVPPAVLAVASDVPMGAGLSSSAALECAALGALADLGALAEPGGSGAVPPEAAPGAVLPQAEWPRIAQHAENRYVGVPCGIMDQSAATFCEEGHALFLDCRDLAYRQVPFDPARTGLAVLLVDTRAPHRLVTGEYAARRAACESAARALGVPALRDVAVADLDAVLARLDSPVTRLRVRHVVTENQRVLDTVARLGAGDLTGIGPLLTASHASLRDDFEVTVPQLDTAVEAALAAGAYGARMTGGGFGGCVLALVDADATGPVGDAVRTAFQREGFRPPATYPVTPSAGVVRHPLG